MKSLINISFLFFLFTACNNNTVNEQVLAKVGKEYLYPSVFLGDDYSAADVQSITEVQIDDWIKKQLWYAEAKKNIENNFEIERKIKDYEQSLYISAFKDKLIKEQPNLVSKEEVVEYYSKNKLDYILSENQYKLQFVEISSELSNLDEIITSLNNDVQSQLIQDYCSENSSLCLLKPTWVNDEKLKEIELPDYVWNTSPTFESYFKDDKKVCLFRILEKKKEGESIPLELVNKEIATILQFNKSKEIFKKQEDQLFKNAQNNQDFEIYK